MKNNIKPIPVFKNEDAEREFWATHDATDYFDESMKVELDLSELKPTAKPVTIRIPNTLMYDLKMIANKKDVPYQSLMKIMLADAVKREYSTK
ncbi:MAG: BrnA antitoxin family protein [Candidatus Shapirobacteria bacterium]